MASATSLALKHQRGEFTPASPNVNAFLTRVPRVAWEEAFSYLTIQCIVKKVARTCKLFRSWSVQALDIKARYPIHAANSRLNTSTDFHRFLWAMKVLKKETLSWGQFGERYLNRTSLSFRNIRFTDTGLLQAMARCSAPTLRSLTEISCDGADARQNPLLAVIQAAPELRHVQLCQATPECNEALLRCRSLESLAYRHFFFDKTQQVVQFNGSLNKLLHSSITLTAFHQDITDVTVDLLKALSRQTGLRALTLGDTHWAWRTYVGHRMGHPSAPIREQLVHTLAALSGLQSLCLKQTEFHCPQNMPDMSYVNDAALQTMATGCPQLSSLTLENCVDVTPKGIEVALKGCAQLTSLSLMQCMNKGAVNLPEFRKIVVLDDDFMAVFERCKTALKVVKVRSPAITDLGVLHLSMGCAKLAELDLSGCSVTDASISLLIGARAIGHLPDLSKLDVSQTTVDAQSKFMKKALKLLRVSTRYFTVKTDNYSYELSRRKVTEWDL